MVVFAYKGSVDWTIGAIMGVGSIVGAWLGARLAASPTAKKYVFPLLVIVISAELVILDGTSLQDARLTVQEPPETIWGAHAAGKTRAVIAAGAIGNVLEWYDFAIYGYFAAAIGRAFFPSEDPVAQVLAAFGIFAVGFLMRPLGGALIGYIGDRFGRRAALTFSVTAMAIPTFLVGVLPGYQVLGVAGADRCSRCCA